MHAFDIASLSDTGRVRTRNEDRIGHDLALGIVALADGMGGHHGGNVAATIAIDTLLHRLKTALPEIAPGEIDTATGYANGSLAVRHAIMDANQAIYATGQAQPEFRGMGTTIVVALFYDNRVMVAHVGDSRIYRFRNDQLEQLTVDHSLVQALVDQGLCTPEQARTSPNRNIMTRALGTEPTVDVDMREKTVMPDDIYLLCSDGLTDMIDDTEISHVVRTRGADLPQTAELLVACANENGGRDNVSVILVRPKERACGQS